jgi:hypothetical protein
MTSSETMGEVHPDAEQFIEIPWQTSGSGCSSVLSARVAAKQAFAANA